MKKITLEEMSLEQKVSFVLCLRRLRNEDDINYILDLVKHHAVGSIQIPPNRPDIVERVRAVADYPIIIVCDMEQGFPTSPRPKVQELALAAAGDSLVVRGEERCISDVCIIFICLFHSAVLLSVLEILAEFARCYSVFRGKHL